MDVLRRPLNGIANRRVGRGFGHDFVAYFVQTRCQPRHGEFLCLARLGLAPVPVAHLACRRGLGCVGLPFGGHAVHVQPIQRTGRGEYPVGVGGLCHRFGGHDRGEGIGAWFLLTPKHQNPCQNCHLHLGGDPSHEFGVCEHVCRRL